MTSPLARIPDLAAWLAASGLDTLDLRGPDGEVRLVRRGGIVAPAAGASPETIAAPHAGHVLAAHPLRDEPLAVPGERVAAGQPVALLRVGSLLATVTAPRAGTVIRVVASDGALVGYGDPLVEIQPEG